MVGDLVFVGGVGPVGEHGEVVAPDDAAGQTTAIVRRMERILAKAGLDLSHLAFVTVYLSDPQQYDRMNEAYAQAMKAPYPARKCVVTHMFGPGRVVEMTAVASRQPRQILTLK